MRLSSKGESQKSESCWINLGHSYLLDLVGLFFRKSVFGRVGYVLVFDKVSSTKVTSAQFWEPKMIMAIERHDY